MNRLVLFGFAACALLAVPALAMADEAGVGDDGTSTGIHLNVVNGDVSISCGRYDGTGAASMDAYLLGINPLQPYPTAYPWYVVPDTCQFIGQNVQAIVLS